MDALFFGYIFSGFVWFGVGWIVSILIDSEFDNMNPLWRIPIVLSGFFSLGIVIVIRLLKAFKSYIIEVKDYYECKRRDRKKKTMM